MGSGHVARAFRARCSGVPHAHPARRHQGARAAFLAIPLAGGVLAGGVLAGSVLAGSVLAGSVLAPTPGRAESTSVGLTFTAEREPDNFDIPKGSDWQIELSHSLDDKITLSGLVKYHEALGDADPNSNTQLSIGYTLDLGPLSLTGTIGAGQHFIFSDDPDSFPFYFIALAGSVPITEAWTWNMFKVRYRRAFDSADGYVTPEVATGVTYALDARNSFSVMVSRDWSDGAPSYTGIEVGYRYRY